MISWWERRLQPPRTRATIAQAQARALAGLVSRLSATAVGRRHLAGLDPHASDLEAAFRRQVPPQDYADIAGLVARAASGEADVLFPGCPTALAQTSGTGRGATATERYIPQGPDLIAHHRQGGTLALARAAARNPSVLVGRMVMLGGCTALDDRGAVPTGDLSGIVAADLPWWARAWHEPGPVIAAEPDWSRRLERIAERTARRDIRLLSGIPAWLLMLLDQLEQRGSPVKTAWPRLRTCIHGGHAIEPFLGALGHHLPADLSMLEVYPASECFLAVGERPWRLGDGQPEPLELLTDHGVWFDFLADDGTTVGAADLEAGGLYTVLVTTPGGLLRYRLGDRVRAVGPGRIRVAGRISTRLSVFGEHVEGDALASALATASADHGAVVAHYHVAPVLPTAGEPRGSHEWLVEFCSEPRDPSRFMAAIDTHLRSHVLDYEAHRAAGQLSAPCLRAIPSGTFHLWMRQRGKLGGQHKVPTAWTDRSVAEALISLAQDHDR